MTFLKMGIRRETIFHFPSWVKIGLLLEMVWLSPKAAMFMGNRYYSYYMGLT
jgi:hypothetical protein